MVIRNLNKKKDIFLRRGLQGPTESEPDFCTEYFLLKVFWVKFGTFWKFWVNFSVKFGKFGEFGAKIGGTSTGTTFIANAVRVIFLENLVCLQCV